MLPDQVMDVLAGETSDGEWGPVFPLLTVNGDGSSQVCLISRAELLVTSGDLRCVLQGRRTTANLARDPRALLMVVQGMSAFYLRVRVREVVVDEQDDRRKAFRLAVETVEEDTLQTPMQPMTFLASERVREIERSDDNLELLQRLT